MQELTHQQIRELCLQWAIRAKPYLGRERRKNMEVVMREDVETIEIMCHGHCIPLGVSRLQ